jgi:hypothetical protein
MESVMLILTRSHVDAINAIDRTRTDGGLGVTFDGADYKCRDVLDDPAYTEYHSLLADAVPDLWCDALQAVEELIDRGMWSSVRLWVNQQDERTQEYFLRAKTWQYRDPRLLSGAAALGLSDADLIEILEAARQR